MQFCLTIRRHLALWLAIAFLAQTSLLGFSPADERSSAAHLSRQLLVTSHRTVLLSGKGLSADPSMHWSPGIAATNRDFRLQWNISILANRHTEGFGLSPAVTERFGRAPPSSIL